jgi:hypothetical protein
MKMFLKWMAALLIMAPVACVSQDIPVVDAWDVELTAPVDHPISVIRGETKYLRPRYLKDGAAASITNVTSVQLWYKPSGLATASWFYVTNGTVIGSGVVQVPWSPDCESTWSEYNYNVVAATALGNSLSAAGKLTLRGNVTGGQTAAPPGRVVYVSDSATYITNGGASINGQAIANGVDVLVTAAVSSVSWPAITDKPSVWPGTATDDVARAAIIVETNRAQVAEALLLPKTATNGAEWGSHADLYPRSNPSNWITAAQVPAESDPVFVTNGVKRSDTNGWTVSSHASFLTTESDPVFATNGVKRSDTNGWTVSSHSGLATNAGGFGAGYYAMSNGAWTAFAPGSGSVQTEQLYVAQAGTAQVANVALSGWPAQTTQVYVAQAGTAQVAVAAQKMTDANAPLNFQQVSNALPYMFRVFTNPAPGNGQIVFVDTSPEWNGPTNGERLFVNPANSLYYSNANWAMTIGTNYSTAWNLEAMSGGSPSGWGNFYSVPHEHPSYSSFPTRFYPGGGFAIGNGTAVSMGANPFKLAFWEDVAVSFDALGAGASAALDVETNLEAQLTGYVATNDARYLAALTNAWQNPASATNWTWTSDGKEITLTDYTGPNAVVIPDMLDGLPVTKLGALLFRGGGVTSVTGGDRITTIGGGAFGDCLGVTSVSFPAATTVGDQAFIGCAFLTSVTFGQNAPSEGSDVYTDVPDVTNYVTSPTATGWTNSWNGRPVVRLPVYADNFYGSGTGITGITAAQVGAAPTNAFLGLVNGLSVRDPTMTIGVDGTGPYATINPSPAGQIEYWFGNSLVQYGTSAVVRLTAGTTNTPTLNYVCALPNGTLTNYTSYPYLTSGTAADARAIMFEVFLIDTNSIAAGYGSVVRSWTDNVENRRGLGRVSWIGERVRRLPAIWESGCQATLLATNSSVATNYVLTASGIGWQMHSHTIPENTNATAMMIINDANGFRTITNLQEITRDSSGALALESNGDCMGVNVMLFVESGITPRKASIMLVLPSDDYNGATPASTKLANCIADSSSYDGTGVPVWMQGMSIRLARLVIRRDSATARTYWVYDRRGQPLGTAGGGASSSGESDPVYGANLASGLIVTNVTYAAAPACYQLTLTNTSALSWTNTWLPTSKVSRVTLTSTGTTTFVWNWPTQQDAGMRFALDMTGMPSVVFPAGAIYLTNGIYGTTAPALGKSNYVSVIHDCNTYQIMAITNTIGTWGTP